jgi:hypothetical protein
MQDHDPFTFLLNEIRAHDAGRRCWPVGERDRRLEQVIAEEAQEVAWGRRHLSIAYGAVSDDIEACALDDAVCLVLDTLEGRWYRLTGVAERYMTVTVDGPDAQHVIHSLRAHLAPIIPRHWDLIDTPIVEVVP